MVKKGKKYLWLKVYRNLFTFTCALSGHSFPEKYFPGDAEKPSPPIGKFFTPEEKNFHLDYQFTQEYF
jgi:hypothetical protein